MNAIRNATESLKKAFYDVSSKIYQQQGAGDQQGPGSGFNAEGGPGYGSGAGSKDNDNVYDADYKVVDDDDEKNK